MSSFPSNNYFAVCCKMNFTERMTVYENSKISPKNFKSQQLLQLSNPGIS